MSITLMAYPMAFLINPDEAKNEKLQKASDVRVQNETVSNENLRSIRVLTNITNGELKGLMSTVDASEVKPLVYVLPNKLHVEWVIKGKYCNAILAGDLNSKDLQNVWRRVFQEFGYCRNA